MPYRFTFNNIPRIRDFVSLRTRFCPNNCIVYANRPATRSLIQSIQFILIEVWTRVTISVRKEV